MAERQDQGSQKTDQRSHNQPSHEAQVKGGQHSHSGSENRTERSEESQGSGSGTHNQPSHEAQVKGGRNSHSGSGNEK